MSFATVNIMLGESFLLNCQIFFVTLLLALPLGLILSFGSMSRSRLLSGVSRLYIYLMRSTPLMLQLAIVYYLPGFLSGGTFMLSRMGAACLAFVLNYAAYFAEIYRSGIQSIPRGQHEAAEVLGYSKAQTFFRIVLPQVVKRIMPSMTNEVITLVKDTSLAFSIGVIEMFTVAKQLVASEVSMLPFAIAAVFYWVFNLLIDFVAGRIERKLSYYHD